MQFGGGDSGDSSQIEDRRGMRFGGPLMFGGGGLGVVGIIAYVIIRLLGGDVSVDNNVSVDNSAGGAPTAQAPVAPTNTQLGGSCAGVTAAGDNGKFISCVVSNVQHFWERTLPERGTAYTPAHLVLFTEATPSGCGMASAASGPFYCPPDGKVYLDLGFFEELHQKFHAKGGEFAEAYVVAHEYGHHIQDLLGIERKMRSSVRQDPDQANAMSVRLELQADCFAGVWGHAAYEKGTVAASEIAQGLDAAAAVGDDRIQKEMTGHVNRERFTHGSSAERQRWFSAGMQTGDIAQCDTFAE